MKKLEQMKGKQLKDAIAKTDVVTFRVSKVDKAEMQATAAKLGLSLTEYLSRLHAIARGKL
jgi:hypothetical protein